MACVHTCAITPGDVELVERLLFDAEATRGATTSWMKEEFGARRRVFYVSGLSPSSLYSPFVLSVIETDTPISPCRLM